MEILKEITLRRIPFSEGSFRHKIKVISLSLGLAKTSNDIITDVLYVLVAASRVKVWKSSDEIYRDLVSIRTTKEENTASSTIRRALKILRDVGFVERERAKYRLKEHKSLQELFQEYCDGTLSDVIKKINLQLSEIDLMNSK